jgi:hypothetical protein
MILEFSLFVTQKPSVLKIYPTYIGEVESDQNVGKEIDSAHDEVSGQVVVFVCRPA